MCLDLQTKVTMLAPLPERGVQYMVKKKWTNRDLKFRDEIDNYEIDDVILDLEYDVNIFPKKTLKKMGNPQLV